MVILDPVSPFLALVDRIISLFKERETKRREYFEKIIEPLYTQFKPLGENYLKLFQEAEQTILNASKTKHKNKRKLSKAVSRIRERREEFASTRAQLRALLEVCEKNAAKKKKDAELADFVGAMARFFQPTVLKSSSRGQELVSFFEEWELHDFSAQSLDHYLLSATARLETSWYEMAGRYMELKLKALGES
jgi:hypothetical protein